MTNVKQTKVRAMKMAEKAAAIMEVHFAGFPEVWLWRRKKNHGYSTIPRTLPIAMQALNEIKGHPAGHTLFCLWARSPDHPFLIIENQATFAAEAGFTGARTVDTWRRRMKILKKYDFIATKKGSSGEFHYVLLLNPNVAVEKLRRLNLVTDDLYSRFLERLADIGGSNDITEINEFWEAAAKEKAGAEEAAAKAKAEAEGVPKPTPVKPPKLPKAARKKPSIAPASVLDELQSQPGG
ncbi:hypothetical protein HX799_13185 [Pseudomonas tolaasii]|uniref:hypothetical protein n=1 Tax=Pseudomonas tolaasii TaxID=29442 RepID=UPI0015A23760|nr:hypothetical protein [Pseudomonas tolaasii]NWC30560.1 hypothetical protein [Pseudomonas tolaasii]NWC52117.1 hypothetical protein [Pseudomonas tolaasii]NWE64323.1 hypothetical protein [Pseudomonas tolaasii]